MFSAARQHAIYAIGNTRVREFPYPHFLGDGIFPEDFYQEILDRLPDKDNYSPITETGRIDTKGKEDLMTPYKNRFTITLTKDVVGNFAKKDQAFWLDTIRLLKNADFMRIILWKFEPYLRQRYPSGLDKIDFISDIQLIRDSEGYSLGPHADNPVKVAVLMLYLPQTADNPDLGTSVYVPKQEGFTCNVGKHYPVKDFHRVFTVPYVPNTALGFFKTTNSFHGVEPVSGPKVQRDLIQFSIKQLPSA